MDGDEAAVLQDTGRRRYRRVTSAPAPVRRTASVGRLSGMEAFFIALMVAVVLLTGWVSIVVLYKLLKADNS